MVLSILKKKKSVLIVDDEAPIRKLVSMHLQNMGLEVIETSNGRDAIATAKSAKPDLLISDLAMPEMSGFDICMALKTDPATSRIPVLLLSGSGKPKDVDKAYEMGIADYLLKPINPERFKMKVLNALK